jgi:hypothetical protein
VRREWRSKRTFRGNCFVWALRQWYRRGGYLVIRRAYLTTPCWHFAWMPKHGRYLYHFRPVNDQVHFPWPYIRGYIARHEDAEGP